MINNPSRLVRDFFNPKGDLVVRATIKQSNGKCAGCGELTYQWDNLFGWYICINCNSDDVASELIREATEVGLY